MADERTGIQRIADERARQIAKLGWSVEHDDGHTDCAIPIVAACYAASAARTRIYVERRHASSVTFEDPFPWEYDARPYGRLWTPEESARYHHASTRLGGNELATDVTDAEAIRLLEKAGALIAAEIDRLVRKAARRG